MIYALAETPDLPLISFKGRKSKDPVRDKLSECGLFAVDIGNPEATAVSLIEWIDERNEYEIENAYNVYSASTRRSAYEASRLVKFAKNTLEVLGNYSNLKDMDYLSARLYCSLRSSFKLYNSHLAFSPGRTSFQPSLDRKARSLKCSKPK